MGEPVQSAVSGRSGVAFGAGAVADVVVAGAGVAGLWAARRALAAGASVTVVERRRVGAGSSGGVLGALMAHTPEPWTEEKQFQLDALVALPAAIAALEAETGLTVGYGRVGRLIPVRDARFLAEARRREAAAASVWGAVDPTFVLEPREPAALGDRTAGWLAPQAAPEGCVWDSLAARVDPRRYLAALAASVRAHPRGAILEGAEVTGYESGAATLSDGRRIAAGALVIAAGAAAFALAERLCGLSLGGRGVKGQAALFDIAPPPGAPMLYDRGVYVMPHADGRIAVGSTAQSDWTGADDAPDPAQRGYLGRARALCPLLADAQPVEEWAGVRPRSATRQPIVGRLPAAAPVWIAGGGYKIGFGLAHAMAGALTAAMTGAEPELRLPAAYRSEAHCEAARG